MSRNFLATTTASTRTRITTKTTAEQQQQKHIISGSSIVSCDNWDVFSLYRIDTSGQKHNRLLFTHHCSVFRLLQRGHLQAVQNYNLLLPSSGWINVKWKEKTVRIQWRCRDGQSCWWRTEGSSGGWYIGAYLLNFTALPATLISNIKDLFLFILSRIFLYFSLFIPSLSFALCFVRLAFPSFCSNICHPFLCLYFYGVFLLFSLFRLISLPVLFYILYVLP